MAAKVRAAKASAPVVTTEVIKRLLVIEDEPEMRLLLARKLTAVGYEVETAESALRALQLIDEIGLPHLAIVDINLPGMSGLEFCDTIQQYSDLPIILVTAVNEPGTTVKAIEKYAEDYIIKPFNLDELVVRVQRLFRRIDDFSYAVGPVVAIDRTLGVNFMRKQVVVNGKVVSLTPIETKVLYILLRHANRVVPNDFLISRIWPDREEYDDTLRVHVHRLRLKMGQKLRIGARKKTYIVTERGLGYRLVTSKEDAK